MGQEQGQGAPATGAGAGAPVGVAPVGGAHVTVWVWHADRWQGLRLAPGESVTLSEGGRTDEGWSRSDETYTRTEDGSVVLLDAYSDGVDCDGRLSTTWHGVCPVGDLGAVPEDDHGPARPRWTELSRRQRDYSAEAAGY